MSNIFLLSDQPVLLAGFEHILRIHGFNVVGRCAAAECAPALRGTAGSLSAPPSIILLDITGGLTFASLGDLNECVPGCPVVLWADALPLELMFKTLEYGVRGIVQRNANPEQLVDALRKVAAGELQIGFGSARDGAQPRRKIALTPREREIVALLRQGLRNKQIAGEMGITEGTVKIYLFRLFHKLGVRNRFELARCGITEQLHLAAPPQTAQARAEGAARPGTLM